MKAVVRITVEAKPRSFIVRLPTQLLGALLVRLGARRSGVRVLSLGYRFLVDGRRVGVRDWVDARTSWTATAGEDIEPGAMVHVAADGLIYRSGRSLPLPAEPE